MLSATWWCKSCPDFISVLLYFLFGINGSNTFCIENSIMLKPVQMGGGGRVRDVSLFITSTDWIKPSLQFSLTYFLFVVFKRWLLPEICYFLQNKKPMYSRRDIKWTENAIALNVPCIQQAFIVCQTDRWQTYCSLHYRHWLAL